MIAKQRRTLASGSGRIAECTLPAIRVEQICYMESSALLASVLELDTAIMDRWQAAGIRIASALTLAEAYRAVVRARVGGRLTTDQERESVRNLETFEQRCDILTVSRDVLTRAGRPFPVEPIRTLDAIHLATVELLDQPPRLITILTRDARIRANARALGYAVA